MRALLLLLGACTMGPSTLQYRQPPPPTGWCNVAAGAYAYTTQPNTVPALVSGCGRARDPQQLGVHPSTFSQLIDPNSTVELVVAIPDAFKGCILDSVVLVHGRTNDGLAVDVRVGDQVSPVLEYTTVPSIDGDRVTDRLPPDVMLYAVRHRLRIAASPLQTIVLHAPNGFSLGVRSDEEAPNDATITIDGKPTHHVAQTAIVLTHCRLPAEQALDTLQRTNLPPPSTLSNR
jgi:hypothetical protein